MEFTAWERPGRLIKFNNRDNRVVLCNWIFSAPELLCEQRAGVNYSGNIWRGLKVFEMVVIYPRMFLKLCLGSSKVVKAYVLVMSIDTSSIEVIFDRSEAEDVTSATSKSRSLSGNWFWGWRHRNLCTNTLKLKEFPTSTLQISSLKRELHPNTIPAVYSLRWRNCKEAKHVFQALLFLYNSFWHRN